MRAKKGIAECSHLVPVGLEREQLVQPPLYFIDPIMNH